MIRDVTPVDAPVLESIQCVSLDSPWPALLDSAIHGGVDCLVATTETETPVGYALFVDSGAEYAVDEQTNQSREQCYLAELAVDPCHRREGYGSSLLETVIDRTDADELLLTARADDTTAKAFYDSHGFRVIERLPDHYDETDAETRDGLLLSKPLSSTSACVDLDP